MANKWANIGNPQQQAYLEGGGRPLYPYHPKDQEPDVAIGVMMPFNGGSSGMPRTAESYQIVSSSSETQINAKANRISGKFPVSYTTEQQALTNLKNLLLTYPGERIMQPTFGVRIKDRVFEPNTPELTISLNREIQDAIKYWLPYIIIDTINIDNRDDRKHITNMLFIKISFKVTEHGANQSITLVTNGESITTMEAGY